MQQQEKIFRYAKPGDSPARTFGARPWVRRLCKVSYNCPLCGKRHRDGMYISIEAEDVDRYSETLRENMENQEYLAVLIFQAMTFHHRQEKGFRKLMLRAQEKGLPEGHRFEPEIDMTDEEAYTCDGCGETFETAPMQRSHAKRCRTTS